jgi:hypothetical protein
LKSVLHLPLKERKKFQAIVLFLEAWHSLEIDTDARQSEATLLESVREIVNQEAINSPPSERLDHFLVRTYARLEKLIGVVLQGHGGDLFGRLKSALDKRLSHVSCDLCSGKAGLLETAICRDHTADDHTVSLGGLCIAPVIRDFTVATNVAHLYHQKHSPSYRKRPQIVLSTTLEAVKPHTLNANVLVGGMTVYSGDGSATVNLQVCVDQYNWNSYLATLYVLFHETIAHGFADLLPDAGTRRRPVDLGDEFSEGWMDFVAHRLFATFCDSEGLGSEMARDVGFLMDRAASGRQMHDSRHDIFDSGGPSGNLNFRRNKGRRAAMKLLDLLIKSFPDGEDTFFRISFELNLRRLDFAQRQIFVGTINSALPEPGHLPTSIAAWEKVCDCLRVYELTGNIDRFFASIGRIFV